MSQKGNNQYDARRHYLGVHTLDQIAEYGATAVARRRRVLYMVIRPNGHVRMVPDDLLEDDTGRGVVGRFTRTSTKEEVLEKLHLFLEQNPSYAAPEQA